jgi:hypothetical protein
VSDRLASAALVSALIRLAEGAGGFGAVLARGESRNGAIAIILLEKGGNPRFFERMPQPNGEYCWDESLQTAQNKEEFESRLARRRRHDPDLWIVELDIACADRFAAEMNALD